MKKANQKTRKNGAESLKFMIATFSLAATLCLWAVFSSQDQNSLVGEVDNPQVSSVAELPQEENTGNLSSESLGASEPVPTLRSVSQPKPNVVVQQQAPIVITGGGGRSVTSTKAS